MNIQIQRSSEPLDDGHGPALAVAYSLPCGGATQPAEEDADERRQYVPAQRGVEGELIAQRPW